MNLFATWDAGVAVFLAAVMLGAVAFAVAPWPMVLKFHVALHGLCAQRPSHSFSLGGQPLPFDARMTGIYGGALLASSYLLARGRWRSVGLPTKPILLLLAALVGLMGLDGINSTLQDFGLPYLYQPSNLLRLATGEGMGVALLSVLFYLVSSTLWSEPAPDAVLRGADIPPLLTIQVIFFALVRSGLGPLYVPLSAALLVGAVFVALLLALVLVVMAAGRDNRIRAPRELGYLPTIALVLALTAVALLAASRFLLERVLGVPMIP